MKAPLLMSDALLSAFVTLFVTIDPLGLAPIFLVVTYGLDAKEQRAIALRAGVIAFLIRAFFAIFGAVLLSALGIGLAALRIGGGLLLFWIAFEMVFETRLDRKMESAEAVRQEQHSRHLAAFPLATPLIAGPGAITAVILISGRAGGSLAEKALMIGLVAAVIGACILAFLAASRIGHALKRSGAAVFSRILGVILTALAVQFVIDGMKSAFRI